MEENTMLLLVEEKRCLPIEKVNDGFKTDIKLKNLRVEKLAIDRND